MKVKLSLKDADGIAESIGVLISQFKREYELGGIHSNSEIADLLVIHEEMMKKKLRQWITNTESFVLEYDSETESLYVLKKEGYDE